MKIPTTHIDLEKHGYPGYWIDVPKSMTEGWLYDWQAQQDAEDEAERKRKTEAEAAGEEFIPRPQHIVNRESMLKLLELVTAWNIDDDAGNVLPLIKNLKKDDDKAKVIRELPLDVFLRIRDAIVPEENNEVVPQATQDFSNAS